MTATTAAERVADEIWHLDGHQLTITLNGGSSGWISLSIHCAVDDRTPTADDPCRVDHSEDGTVTREALDFCNFTAWLAEDNPMDCLDTRVSVWEVATCPLDIAVRWDGDGYEWAPRKWAASRTGGAA